MSSVMTATPSARVAGRGRVQAERLFYVIAAYVMLVFTAIGFRNFYLHARAPWGAMTGAIVPLIVTHGLAMSGWFVLFCIQSTLILQGNRKLHMTLGRIGGVLAAAIVVLGPAVAVMSTHYNPELYGPFGGARFFLTIMLSEIALFGLFVGIGLVNRNRADIHRPMMLLASIVISSGALARTPYVETLAGLPPFYAYEPALILAALLFVLHWGMTRATNRSYLIGYAGIMATSFAAAWLGTSALWNQMWSSLIK